MHKDLLTFVKLLGVTVIAVGAYMLYYTYVSKTDLSSFISQTLTKKPQVIHKDSFYADQRLQDGLPKSQAYQQAMHFDGMNGTKEQPTKGLSSLPVSFAHESSKMPFENQDGSSGPQTVNPNVAYNTNILAPPAQSNQNTSVSGSTPPEFAPLGCFPKDQLTSEDLLPKTGGWEASNPSIPLSSLSGANFLTSGTMYGINTTGSSLRNANVQLRSDPPIPRINVGPWQQSTIEPDNNRKYLEIGNS